MGTITDSHAKHFAIGGVNEKKSLAVNITVSPRRLEVAEYHTDHFLVFAERGIRESAKRLVIPKCG